MVFVMNFGAGLELAFGAADALVDADADADAATGDELALVGALVVAELPKALGVGAAVGALTARCVSCARDFVRRRLLAGDDDALGIAVARGVGLGVGVGVPRASATPYPLIVGSGISVASFVKYTAPSSARCRLCGAPAPLGPPG